MKLTERNTVMDIIYAKNYSQALEFKQNHPKVSDDTIVIVNGSNRQIPQANIDHFWILDGAEPNLETPQN